MLRYRLWDKQMSYILDALKREQSEQANFALQHDHQQDYELASKLAFYRKLAFGFGFVVAIGAGFAIGKTAQLWLEKNSQDDRPSETEIAQKVTTSDVDKKTNIEPVTEPKMADNNPVEQAQPTATQTELVTAQQMQIPGGMQLVPVQVTNGAVMNMPVQYKLVPVQQIYQAHQMVPSYVPANGQLVAQGYQQPVVANQSMNSGQMIPSNGYAGANVQPIYQQPMQQYAQPQSTAYQQPQQQESAPQTAKEAVSELAVAFQEAMQKVDKTRLNGREQVEVKQSSTTASNVQPIELLPDSIASRLPKIQYQAHIFVSEPSRRWIKVNGKELYEGDLLQGMQVVEITRDVTVFSYQGYEFAVSALSDWN